MTVILSHSLTLGGRPGAIAAEDILNSSLGQIAVFGFFGISGFLIARSADHNRFGRYLWQRVLRIFPAYWACLLVTAFVFGVIAWGYTQRHGLSYYFNSSTGPFQYVYHDALLRPNQPGIAGTPVRVPLPGIWNISFWTLQYEFVCYLLLGTLAAIGLLKRRPFVVLLAAGVWVIASYFTFSRNPLAYSQTGFDEARLLGLVPLFLVGALLYLYRDTIPDSGLLAAGSAAVFIGTLWLPFGTVETYSFFPTVTAAVVFSVFLAYPMIWLGIHLPLQRIGARNDYSYGVYVYASPVQQLLATWGVQRWGMAVFMTLSVGGTIPFAVASWWFIERHALKLKSLGRTSARGEIPPLEATGGSSGRVPAASQTALGDG
jgi:peptidoglycan/LPS O-acetylase OafA/YrhL